MKNIINKNKELLANLYNYTFNDLSRHKVFDVVALYKNNPTLHHLRLAIAMILKWGDYTTVIGRNRRSNEIELVKKLDDTYNDKFLGLFVKRIDSLSPKECFRLFDNELKIDTVSYAYFTKILYFFSPREKGLVILDKWLAINSLVLAAELNHPYATKWYRDVLKNDTYQYSRVKEQTYEDYINFMQDAKQQFGLVYADELETLLFGWRKQFNKRFSGYHNPRNVLQVTETEKPIKVKSVVNEITTSGEININDVLISEDITMLKDFIAKRPNGTMDFATLLGYEKDSPEWKRAYTKMNSIIKKLQANSASCKLFFDETVYRLNLE